MMSPAPSPATTSLHMICARFACAFRPYKNASHSIQKVSRRRFTKMSPRRAWVREKKPKMTKEVIDPTVALLPMLNYLGCRPNNHAASYRVKEDSPEEEDEFIEIVTPRRQQQQQQHHPHQHQQQHSSSKYSPQYSQEQPISRQHQQNRHQELRSATARASAAAQSRTATNASPLKTQRLGPHSTGDTRRYAGGGGGGTSRTSPHMSRAMAVNLDAMTPLAM